MNITNHNYKTTRAMKVTNYLLATALFLTTFSHALVAQEAAPVKVDNPNAPEITFESETHDYGTIKQGADGGCEFKFKNTGKDPLIVSGAKGNCGCTVPNYPKEPIMKNQTGVIKVHYDTKRVGAFTKTVTINSNGKTDPKVLTIKGVVEASDENAEQAMPVKKSSGLPLENSK